MQEFLWIVLSFGMFLKIFPPFPRACRFFWGAHLGWQRRQQRRSVISGRRARLALISGPIRRRRAASDSRPPSDMAPSATTAISMQILAARRARSPEIHGAALLLLQPPDSCSGDKRSQRTVAANIFIAWDAVTAIERFLLLILLTNLANSPKNDMHSLLKKREKCRTGNRKMLLLCLVHDRPELGNDYSPSEVTNTLLHYKLHYINTNSWFKAIGNHTIHSHRVNILPFSKWNIIFHVYWKIFKTKIFRTVFLVRSKKCFYGSKNRPRRGFILYVD